MAEQQPTIAELWQEFQKLFKVGKRNPLYWSKVWDKTNLRAQLLERCKRVPDQDGDITTLYLTCHLDRLATEPCGILERVDNIETAREISAAYAFWAWELEQRAKEVGNG